MDEYQINTADFQDGREGQRRKETFIEHILSMATHKMFSKVFFDNISLNDLKKLEKSDLLKIVEEVTTLILNKKDGATKISFFTTSIHEKYDITQTSLAIVNNDKPFLVDSIVAAIVRLGYSIDILIHPILAIERDKTDRLISVSPARPDAAHQNKESIIYIRLNELLRKSEIAALETELTFVMTCISYAINDWQAMRTEISQAIQNITLSKEVFTQVQLEEIKSFLHWLDMGYFTFLGFRCFHEEAGKITLVNKLGIMRNEKVYIFRPHKKKTDPYVDCKEAFKVTKSVTRSVVHRDAPMDVIRLKKFDEKGKAIGFYEFIGLFTSTVYNSSIKHIPLIRQKLSYVMEHSGLSPLWHDGKTLLHTLETFPRGELFQIEPEQLLTAMKAIVDLQQRQRLALFVRQDSLGHLVSAIVYVPRDKYNSSLRERMATILETELNGKVNSFHPLIDRDTPYARVYYTLVVNPTKPLHFHHAAIEQALLLSSMTWEDHLKEKFFHVYPSKIALKYIDRFLHAFPNQYKETYSVDNAVKEIDIIEQVLITKKLTARIYAIEATPGLLNLKLYHYGNPFVLSDILPILENMGLKTITESYYKIRDQKSQEKICLYDFKLKSLADDIHKNLPTIRDNFQEALIKVWDGQLENDGFNALMLNNFLTWREVLIVRAYYKYLKQIEFVYSQPFVEDCLQRNRPTTKKIIQFFEAMFNPKDPVPPNALTKFLDSIEEEFDNVESSDDDKILRQFLNLILATVRTNYFQTDVMSVRKNYLSFKFDARLIQNLPLPRPMYEIFIYSVDMEAIHLRTGKVARGGIRWSDRPEDFRKEILGLVKAQRVKNAVIIPVGAKGGFVVKKDLSMLSPDEKYQEGVRCYKMMMQALLDITDNRINNRTIKPKKVRRCYDGDDPYLVVAADKGTSTFSDIANAISLKNKFWLGDAFASGGSHGYDHKKIGITARGAWEAVTRHFKEMGVNIQTTPFTAVGIGDMSGDVFGNGMLLSNQIKLVAAFNHLHIFVDPNPDPEKSFEERAHLFKMPRSSWADYNEKLLSKGGGIFSRRQKYITLTPEMRTLFQVNKKQLSPEDLIRTILTSAVDLMWFGGIGTYVKASHEMNESIGDRANDSVRVNASDLKARIIGEGANLGITQPGRVEYALQGGRINTDAIDNAGGVNCSDHEVNIKILLNHVVQQKKLSETGRNTLLKKMTDNVAELVLRDNYLQPQAITMIESRGYQVLERQTRLMKKLEKIGLLDRKVENLPDDETIEERLQAHKGLTRPEIAVLLAYGKLFIYEKILQTTIPDEPILNEFLVAYFPKLLQERFGDKLKEHPLRREIIATRTANSLVNRVGPTFFNEMIEITDATPEQVIRAYLIVRDSLNVAPYWHAIEALDCHVVTDVQNQMMRAVVELIEHSTRWLLMNYNGPLNISKCIPLFSDQVNQFKTHMEACIKGDFKKKILKDEEGLIKKKVPQNLAHDIAHLEMLQYAWDIMQVANKYKTSITIVSEVYFFLFDIFGFHRIKEKMQDIPLGNRWQKKSIRYLLEQLSVLQARLVESALKKAKKADTAKDIFERWYGQDKRQIQQFHQLIEALHGEPTFDLSMAYVFINQLETLL